ncbi:hypothetical protein [Candidatus Palauibacter sp.]|uniref:hypothetical protein n=1 Tax=Candidatus Palauibacter sp. TaxID=3101350 RepID=UPI003C6F0E54
MAADTDLGAGILEGAGEAGFNKGAALRDVEALEKAKAGFSAIGREQLESVLRDLTTLDGDPALLEAIARRSFVERGLGLIDGTVCPLCDTDWEDAEALRTHLRGKLTKAAEAEALERQLLGSAAEIANQAERISGLAGAVQPLGRLYGPDGCDEELESWSSDLKAVAGRLNTVESIAEQRDRLEEGWSMPPGSLQDQLEAFRQTIQAKPDQSVSVAAQTFLTRAQDRFLAWQNARRETRRAEAAVEAGRATYNTYCEVADGYLRALYEAVEDDFGTYYRQINAEDEGGFRATLAPAEGGLDLEVAFYDKACTRRARTTVRDTRMGWGSASTSRS